MAVHRIHACSTPPLRHQASVSRRFLSVSLFVEPCRGKPTEKGGGKITRETRAYGVERFPLRWGCWRVLKGGENWEKRELRESIYSGRGRRGEKKLVRWLKNGEEREVWKWTWSEDISLKWDENWEVPWTISRDQRGRRIFKIWIKLKLVCKCRR